MNLLRTGAILALTAFGTAAAFFQLVTQQTTVVTAAATVKESTTVSESTAPTTVAVPTGLAGDADTGTTLLPDPPEDNAVVGFSPAVVTGVEALTATHLQTPPDDASTDTSGRHPQSLQPDWLDQAAARHPDTDYWREQIASHRNQQLSPGWMKYAVQIVNSKRDLLSYPTFEQMASTEHQDGRLIVKVNDETRARTALESTGFAHERSIGTGTITQKLHLYVIPVDYTMTEALELVNAMDAVAYAEPNYSIEDAMSPAVPNDPQAQPGVAWWWTTVNAYEAWDYATDARAIGPIADIDTGINTAHPDLDDNLWVNPGEIAGNGVDDDNNGYIDDIHGINWAQGNGNIAETYSHGTQVAGLICAEGNNGAGVTGAAWDCELMSLHYDATFSGALGAALAGIDYAISNGSRIIVHEYGLQTNSLALQDVFDRSEQHDMLHIIAAHNNGVNFDTGGGGYRWPATYTNPNTIVVGASDRSDGVVSYSNRGHISVDLASPTDLTTTIGSSAYGNFNGTSAATPPVAGAVALMWSRTPNWTAAQAKQHFLANVRPVAAWSGLSVTGGIMDMGAVMRNQIDQDPVTVSVDDTSVVESDGTAQVNVTLSRAANTPVSVTAFTRAVPGSAVAGQDFYGKTEVVNFAAGETSKSVAVTLVDDTTPETVETLTLRLVSPSGATVDNGVATVTINDDDSGTTPSLSVSNQSFNESVGTAAVAVTLSPAAIAPVTVVAFTRATGTAQAGQDFYGTTQTLSFAPGETVKTLNVTVLDDSAPESAETLNVRLVQPTGGASIGNGDAVVMLTDNDSGDATLSVSSVSVNEGAGTATVTISVSRSVSASVTAFTRSGTALGGGQDYFGQTETISFTAGGPTVQSMTFGLNDDSLAEGTETMSIRLTDAVGASIAVGAGTVTITDND